MAETYSVEAILKATGAKGFQDAFKKSGDATTSFKDKAGKAMKVAGAAIAAGAAAATTALVAMGVETAEAADEVHKGSQRIGVSTDAYQEMDYWASQNGLSHNDMEKAVGRLNQRIGLAEQGNAKYADAFANLGVEIKDAEGNMRSTEDVMTDSITTLSQMENESEKAAMASELFGTKLGRELMPALQDGALSMEDAAQVAQEMGMVMDESAIQAGVAFTDNMDTAKRALGGITREIGAAVLPIFNTMLEWVLENLPAIKETFKVAFDAVVTVFNTVIDTVQTVIGWFASFGESTDITFESIRETIEEVMTNVWGNIQNVWTAITSFWKEHGEEILSNAITVFTSVWETVELYIGYVQDVIETVLGIVVPFIEKQLEKITAFWDENGEQIMQAVENAFNFIQGVIDFVMPIVTAIIEGAWDIITTAFDTAIDVIMGLVDVFSSLLTGDFEGIETAISGIWDDLWEGIKGVVEGAWSMLSGAFGALWDNISGWFTDLKDDAFNWGKNMISGFTDGIRDKFDSIRSAASDAVSAAGDFLKFWSPAKKGEGRYIEHWGANMMDGFLDGVRSQERNAQKAINSIIDSMQPSNMDTIDINGSITRSNAEINATMRHQFGNLGSESKVVNNKELVINQYITSPEPMDEREMQRRSRLEVQKLGVDYAF